MHDEYLFVRSAWWLLSGNWLGPYDQLTLTKGIFYPLWIAFNNIIKLPLLLSNHLLYIGACIAMTIAIRPLIPDYRFLIIIYILLLYNPMSFSAEVMPRVIRDGIYPSLTLLCFAGAIGIYSRVSKQRFLLWPWIALYSFSLPSFWLTREEGIWLMPGLVLLLIATLPKVCELCNRLKASFCFGIAKMALILMVPFFILILSSGFVSFLNWYHYGVFTSVEIRSKPFIDAYGALSRVKHPEPMRYVPMPRELRYKVYSSSPAFNELSPYLEGPVSEKWVGGVCSAVPYVAESYSSDMYRYGDLLDVACKEIAGGWFIWALRDSAALAGYHEDALIAQSYYRRLAKEIDTACESDIISCLPSRNSLAPPINILYWESLFISAASAFKRIIFFEKFSPYPLPSWGTEEQVALFQSVVSGHFQLPGHNIEAISKDFRFQVLLLIGHAYQKLFPFFILLGFFSGVIITYNAARRKIYFSWIIILAAIIIVIMSRIIILSLIDVYSFPALSSQYLSALHPLMIFAVSVTIIVALNEFLGFYEAR